MSTEFRSDSNIKSSGNFENAQGPNTINPNNSATNNQSSNHSQADSKSDLGNQNITNILSHVKRLEEERQNLTKQLEAEKGRSAKHLKKTKEAMGSTLNTLMKKWMDAVETQDDRVKTGFKEGLDQLVENSAEDNGVWQMMVAASALHDRQEHNLDKLIKENTELRTRVDGMYEDKGSRTVGEKSKAKEELSRVDVEIGDIWGDFAQSIGSVY
jgi:hypothetical protein